MVIKMFWCKAYLSLLIARLFLNPPPPPGTDPAFIIAQELKHQPRNKTVKGLLHLFSQSSPASDHVSVPEMRCSEF